MSTDKPTGFNDLKPAELYRSALEDFALPVEEDDKGKKKVLVAAFVEGGVTWEDYVAQHPEVAPEPVVEEVVYEPSLSNTVESAVPAEPTEKWADEPVAVATAPVTPIVKEELSLTSPQPYLIKMVRDNPMFQTRGHTFTQSHPYALVSAADAEYILSKEDGFRQAFPSELQEFYG